MDELKKQQAALSKSISMCEKKIKASTVAKGKEHKKRKGGSGGRKQNKASKIATGKRSITELFDTDSSADQLLAPKMVMVEEHKAMDELKNQ